MHAETQDRTMIELPADSSTSSAPARPQGSEADIAHSENNILRWMSYLPEDCIRTMVLMGWDHST